MRAERKKLAAQVETMRDDPRGIQKMLLKHPLFRTGGTYIEGVVRRNVTDLLDPLPSEEAHPGRYLRRLRKELRTLLATFPDLRHYVEQLEWSEHSIWFWAKQRSMLFMMRRGRDLHYAFSEARTMSADQVRELLGSDIYTPGLILASLLAEWMPKPKQNRDRPLKVRLRWIEILKSPTVPSLTRFTVSLRLGMASSGVQGDPAAEAALRAIPRNLRMLDAFALLDVTQNVAQALGPESVRDSAAQAPARRTVPDAPRSPGASEEPGGADRGHPPQTQDLETALEKQRSALREPATHQKDKGLDEAIAKAQREAARRIDHWLTTGVDPGRPVQPPRRSPRRPRPTRLEKTYERHSSLERQTAAEGGLDSDLLNLAAACGFDPIRAVGELPPDPKVYRALVAGLRPQIRILRRYLLHLGSRAEEEFGQRSGRRLDLARLIRLAVVGDPHVLVGRSSRPAPDIFVGVAIDCSGSMSGGTRMDKAKSFGALILESTRRLPGVAAHVVGFTDSMVYDLGGPGETSIARLEPEGGNNDAAGLLHAARFALASKKARRLLVMISDGYPTECSFESLCRLVEVLESRYRICCAQVAVDSLDEERIAFPHYTDLTEHTPAGAAAAFGRQVQRLIQSRFDVLEPF